MATERTTTPIQTAVELHLDELNEDYSDALDLLLDFCERFYWIKDHPDYQQAVRKFLADRGLHPKPYGH